MQYSTVFFDLDDTLYPSSNGLWGAIKERMNMYMRDRMGFAEEDIPRLREQYFRQYGTTLRGLQANHGVDEVEFLAYVHDIPLGDYLRPDPVLRQVITSLPTQNLVFTNADAGHARRVLTALDLNDLFEKVVDINAVAPYCKPMPEAFKIAMRVAGENDPGKCVMIDDLPHTVQAARETGMYGILCGSKGYKEAACPVLVAWEQLPALLNGRTK